MWAGVVRGASLVVAAGMLAGCVSADDLGRIGRPALSISEKEISRQSGLLDVSASSTLKNGDEFLTALTFSEGTPNAQRHKLYKYEAMRNGTGVVGYGVKGRRTPTMPTTGGAHYSGSMAATLIGSESGREEMRGKFQMDAIFSPTGGAVEGAMYDLRTKNRDVPFEMRMKRTSFRGGTVKGQMDIVSRREDAGQRVGGGPAIPGLKVTKSHYNGAFFGKNAIEFGGSFSINAKGVPIRCGAWGCSGYESVKIVGGVSGVGKWAKAGRPGSGWIFPSPDKIIIGGPGGFSGKR